MGLMGPGFTNTARIAVYCVLYVLILYYVLIQTIHGPRCTRHVPRIEPLMKPKILATGEHVSTYAWLTASLESAWNRPTGRYTGIHDIPIPRRLRRRIPIPGRLRRPYPYPYPYPYPSPFGTNGVLFGLRKVRNVVNRINASDPPTTR